MSLSRLNSLLSRSAVVRKRIELEAMRRAPSTLELIRLKALLLKLQLQISAAILGESIWNNRQPTLAYSSSARPRPAHQQMRRVS